MKPQILLLAITAAAISSCTTAYKTGQTPDDVYFSPARPHDEYVRVEEEDNRQYRYDDQYYDDRYLRMKVADRTRWSELNDWYYYDRYSYTHNYYYGTYNNPYNSWNYYYNPYCHPYVVVLNPKQSGSVTNYVKPRNFSLGSYTNNNFNNTNTVSNIKIAPVPGTSRPVFNNSNVNTNTSNNSKGLGNTIRQIFSGKNNDTYYNNNNSSNSNSTNRTYNPSNSSNSNNSSSGSSNNSSSGSGGGGVTRPTRGGN
ncbi:MAG: hypothetical protein EPN92_03240 [Chitinophagaceae bacterium]|nr:MAG: hypothetical protein EPN92_03240 [Chitinophagaceae bacterium]